MILPQRLGPSPAHAAEIVAIRDGHPLDRALFERAVGGHARELAGRERVVLACRDGWNLAAALLGALTAGAQAVLPANDLPATLAELDGLVVDDAVSPAPAPWMEPPPPQARLLFHTSGSTGSAKPVPRTLGQLAAEIAALEQVWGATVAGAAATVATVPHQHAYGLMFALLWPLAAGRPFHAVRHPLWEDLLAAMPAAAVVVSSPAHLARMGGLPALAPDRRPRLLLSAGAPLSEPAATEARRVFGVAVSEIYGSTETGAVATRRRDGGIPPWRPLPGHRVGATADGLLRLGAVVLADRVDMAADGGFHLRGRADRVAKIEGKRVALDEVEAALSACAEVSAAAVTVLDDPEPVLAAVVVPSAAGWESWCRLGGFRLGRTLRRTLARRLEAAGLPRRWRFVAELPHGPLGKHRTADLHALFAQAPRLPEVLAAGRDGDGLRLDLAVPENLWWFQGHFPGRPILPGLAQLDWVLHFARRHLGLGVVAATDFQVKFTAVVNPRDRLELDIGHDVAKGRLRFAYRRDGRPCSSGSVRLP